MSKQIICERRGEAAMTFVDIARTMGYRDPENRGKKAVFMVYRCAMAKLRRRPQLLRKVRTLASAAAAERKRREAHAETLQ